MTRPAITQILTELICRNSSIDEHFVCFTCLLCKNKIKMYRYNIILICYLYVADCFEIYSF